MTDTEQEGSQLRGISEQIVQGMMQDLEGGYNSFLQDYIS